MSRGALRMRNVLARVQSRWVILSAVLLAVAEVFDYLRAFHPFESPRWWLFFWATWVVKVLGEWSLLTFGMSLGRAFEARDESLRKDDYDMGYDAGREAERESTREDLDGLATAAIRSTTLMGMHEADRKTCSTASVTVVGAQFYLLRSSQPMLVRELGGYVSYITPWFILEVADAKNEHRVRSNDMAMDAVRAGRTHTIQRYDPEKN